jgi:hypothetical protein
MRGSGRGSPLTHVTELRALRTPMATVEHFKTQLMVDLLSKLTPDEHSSSRR